jgi:hypothetical protein
VRVEQFSSGWHASIEPWDSNAPLFLHDRESAMKMLFRASHRKQWHGKGSENPSILILRCAASFSKSSTENNATTHLPAFAESHHKQTSMYCCTRPFNHLLLVTSGLTSVASLNHRLSDRHSPCNSDPITSSRNGVDRYPLWLQIPACFLQIGRRTHQRDQYIPAFFRTA